jgi:hypothetical protein
LRPYSAALPCRLRVAALLAYVVRVGRVLRALLEAVELGREHGRAVQADSIKPKLKLPGTKRLKREYVESPSNFAFKFNLRRYSTASGSSITSAGAWTRTARGWRRGGRAR